MNTLFDIPTTVEVNGQGKGNPMRKAVGVGPRGYRCQACRHLSRHGNRRRYYKCARRAHNTHGPATDHRATPGPHRRVQAWPACAWFELPDRADQ